MDRYIEFVTNHRILFIALCVVTYLLIKEFFASVTQKFESISPMLAVTHMNNDNTSLIDVREKNDFSNGHIENAINAPLGKFDEQLNLLEQYKNSPLIVVCQNGSRSTTACRKLNKHGFTNIYHLRGGMQSWEDSKLPIKKEKKSA